jgi:hypothetical protein
LLLKRIAVKWVGGWYAGRVTGYVEQKDGAGKHQVTYDDGDIKEHKLTEKSWQVITIKE